MTPGESLAALTACVLWSTAFPVVKIGLKWMPPFTFAGIRFMLAGLLVALFCGPGRIRRALGSHPRLVFVVALLQTVALYGAFFWSVKLVGGAKSAIVVGSSPWISMLMAHWMMHDDRLSLGKLGVLALGAIGLVLLAVGRNPEGTVAVVSTPELLGMGILLAANIGSNLSNIYIARDRRGVDPVALNGSQMFLGGCVLLVAGLTIDGLPSTPPAVFYLVVTWAAIVSAVGFSIWFTLLKRIKVSYLNMYKCLMPIFGAILSWIVLPDESPTTRVVTGMILTAAAVLLSQLLASREKRG